MSSFDEKKKIMLAVYIRQRANIQTDADKKMFALIFSKTFENITTIETNDDSDWDSIALGVGVLSRAKMPHDVEIQANVPEDFMINNETHTTIKDCALKALYMTDVVYSAIDKENADENENNYKIENTDGVPNVLKQRKPDDFFKDNN